MPESIMKSDKKEWKMRLDKFLAEASVGTRKTIRNYVQEGKVTVNNLVILNPAIEIDENTDIIRYLGNDVIHAGKVYYMFHKPGGCITARKDVNCRTVLDYFDVDNRNGLFPVGRLDKDTEGLLLLTNDGEFNHRLMYPDKHVEKTYFFWAFGSLNCEEKEHLKTGITIGEEEALAKALRIEVEEEGTYQELQDKMNMETRKDIRINPNHQPVVSGYITITEGRKHQVKRMLKAVGCYVVYLKRVSIGGLMLDQTLKKGQYRELTEKEIRTLQ
jgi:16S rRNA pseudouridine516 synthase